MSSADCLSAIEVIVEAPKRTRKSSAPTPDIFFNALFAFGAYQKLAADFDRALPSSTLRKLPT